MSTFSPQTFLTNQGWEGPGSGLQKGSIKKPVTVPHKTNLKGIGKERDTGYAWWDDVFSMVANKKKGGDNPILRKTSTGIHSPLPPGSISAVSSLPDSGSSTPVASTSGSHFHTDIIGHAKLEAARREFYAKFTRGRPLEGTKQEAIENDVVMVEEVAVVQVESQQEDGVTLSKEEKKKLKELRRAEKEQRRALKKEKKDKKKKKTKGEAEVEADQDELPSVAVTDPSGVMAGGASATGAKSQDSKAERKKRKREAEAEGEAEEEGIVDSTGEEPKAARKARKEEKRRRKAEKSSS